MSSRRHFLQAAVALPSLALSASPNARLRVAVVGMGGRGRKAHCTALHQLAGENVEIAAVCDCDENRLHPAAEEVEKLTGKRPAAVFDFRKLLNDKSVDAVTLATPNHWHALQTIWACQAGKDVYVEQPASHNVLEGRRLIEAVAKYGRIVQHGTQCRSSPNIREAVEKLRQGVIGRVYMARGVAFKLHSGGRNELGPVPAGMNWNLWLGPAADAPYNKLAVSRWRFLHAYGNGEIGDQGIHQLDILRWGLALDTHPTRVQSMGGLLAHDDVDEDLPSNQTFGCQYEGRRLLVQFECRSGYTNSEAGMGTEYPFVDRRGVVGVIFFGTEGHLIVPDNSSYHTFLGSNREPGPSAATPGSPTMDLEHFRNWVAAVRSRKPAELTAPVVEAHYTSTLAHLANIAYYTARTLRFDPRTEQFPDAPDANRFLTRPYREPFVVPERV